MPERERKKYVIVLSGSGVSAVISNNRRFICIRIILLYLLSSTKDVVHITRMARERNETCVFLSLMILKRWEEMKL